MKKHILFSNRNWKQELRLEIERQNELREESVAKECTRATTAETELQKNIAAEKSRAEAAEEQLRKDLDAETDANISAFAEVANRIYDEKTRAEAAEEQLQTNISSVAMAASQDKTALQKSIADEKTRAEAAEEQLRKDLDAETDANISAFAEVANRIYDEKTRAEAAEEQLQTNISSVAMAASQDKTALQKSIADEKTRAEAAETELRNSIGSVNNRVEAAEKQLHATQKSKRNYLTVNGESATIISKFSDHFDIIITFAKVMTNNLYSIEKVYLAVNHEKELSTDTDREIEYLLSQQSAESSDIIGPVRVKRPITGDSFVGGNHLYLNQQSGVRSAATNSYTILADGAPVTQGSVYADVITVKVENTIFDPDVAPASGETILSEPLIIENVAYNISNGEITVGVEHRYLKDVHVGIYYGMQSMFVARKLADGSTAHVHFITTQGGDWQRIAGNDTKIYIKKSEAPNLNRFSQKHLAGHYQNTVLLPYGLGNHDYINDDGNICLYSNNKAYHVLIQDKDIASGSILSWMGIYNWKRPVADDEYNYIYEYGNKGVVSVTAKKQYSNISVPAPTTNAMYAVSEGDGNISIKSVVANDFNLSATKAGSVTIIPENDETRELKSDNAALKERIAIEETRAEAAEERIASDVSALTKKVNEIKPVEYTNSTIVNAADEEDITSGDDNLLRLKDRLPNGRTAGYKILRLDKSFTEQVCDDDTVYEIRYDFDLDGVQDFQIPANCVLKFEGGSLRNGTLTGNNTLIDARVERIFNTDVTINGAWKISEAYPEWFGADPALEDNSAYINKAIEQLNNLPNPTILILTSAYKIKSTVWLRKNVSIVGIKEYDSYTTVTPKNKNAGSGFIVNFTDPCAYALDTYLLKDGEQYIYPYNQMWIDIESDGISEPQNRDSGYVIKNININIDSSLLDDPEKGIFFGGIRLIDRYYGTLENIRIKGAAVGISLYNSWNMDIRNIFIICAVCGFYFGKYNTIQTVYNSLVEDSFWGRRLEWTEREGEELIWKNTDLFPPYDEKGEIPLLEDGSENTKFTAPIKVQSSAVISESYETDRNKLYFIGCTFQLLDAVSISSTCNLSFDFCYNEKIRKVLIWARGGTIRWKNPSFNGNKVRPYTFGTQIGNITIEGMTDFNCYPYCKKSNDGFYGYISDNFVYHYDKYQGVEGPSETGESGSFPNVPIDLTEAVSAPKRMPTQNVFYLGLVNYVLYYDYRIIGVASGLTKGRFTTFDTIMKAYRPKNATFITQSCSTDVGKNHEMWEDCNYTFKADKSETGKVSASFVTSKALSLKNSKLHIPDFALTNQPRGYFDDPAAKTVNLTDGILFKCYGKNEIVAPQYIESKNFIELCGTEKIELNVVFKGVYFAAKNLFYNLDTCETKYKVTATVDSGTFVFTNPTPPKYGNEIGDVFMLSKDGVTTPVYWDGAKWVDSAGAEV